jgi:hypothetical protein
VNADDQMSFDAVPDDAISITAVQSQSTLYKIADVEIRKAIESYLKLVRATNGLANIQLHDLADERPWKNGNVAKLFHLN